MVRFTALIYLMSLAGIAAAPDGRPHLKHREHSFTIRLNASVAKVTPLFGPVREAEWAAECRPQFVYPEVPTQIEGAVFTTTKDNHQRIWVLNRLDVEHGRVEYVIVTPKVTTNHIKISVVADGPNRSHLPPEGFVAWRKSLR